MNKITDKIIELVEKDNLNDFYWLSELGYANSKINNLDENDFLYSFYEQGKAIWGRYKDDLRKLICDTDNGVPKPYIQELIGGDIRQILETLTTAIIATFKIEFAVALPLTCLLLKYNINKFCAFN